MKYSSTQSFTLKASSFSSSVIIQYLSLLIAFESPKTEMKPLNLFASPVRGKVEAEEEKKSVPENLLSPFTTTAKRETSRVKMVKKPKYEGDKHVASSPLFPTSDSSPQLFWKGEEQDIFPFTPPKTHSSPGKSLFVGTSDIHPTFHSDQPNLFATKEDEERAGIFGQPNGMLVGPRHEIFSSKQLSSSFSRRSDTAPIFFDEPDACNPMHVDKKKIPFGAKFDPIHPMKPPGSTGGMGFPNPDLL
ncbi:hypothetical protein ADUPG1_008983 [Aduncisulcus paluster]|nr:hypothetical protein ADUPG1_008983 [Aduncisulcus paluster]